jgi:hypothetical protein
MMMKAGKNLGKCGPVLLTVEQVSGPVGMDPQLLRNWIAAGILEPPVRGGKGRGRTHLLSCQEAVGVAFCYAMTRADVFNRPRQVRHAMSLFEKMSWDELDTWLKLPKDEWQEEERAAKAARQGWKPVVDDLVHPPEWRAVLHDAFERMWRVYGVIEQETAGHMQRPSKQWRRGSPRA